MRKMSAKGVRSLGGGRYQISVWWLDPKTGKQRRAIRKIQAKDAREAARKRDDLRETLVAGDAPPERETFEVAAKSWLASKAPGWKASTREQHAAVMDEHILPRCGDVCLGEIFVDKITKQDIVQWRDAQLATGVLPVTVNSRLRLLRQVLRDVCSDAGLVSPAAAVDGMREGFDEEREVYYLDAGEARAVLAWLREHRPQWYPLVALLALTGLRFGEATALRWTDLARRWSDDADRSGDEAWIRVRRAQWKGVIDHPKSRVGKRDVPLSPELDEILTAHRRAQLERQQRGMDTGYIFLSRVGTLHDNSVLQKPVRAALEAKKITGRFPCAHGWRKVHNNLLRQVADDVVRQALIGHADAKTGQRHYSRAELDEMRRASATVVRLVTGSGA